MLSPTTLATRLTVDRKRSPKREAAELVEACLAGEKTAWDDLVDQYGRLVYSIARRYGLSDADADDVFQSVFLTVMENLASLRQRERFSSWLITVTHRQCWQTARRSGCAADLAADLAAGGPPAEEDVFRWEQQHLVHRALETLGGSCEGLLRALFAESGPPNYGRIAEKLGMKVGSIGPTRARCFRKLERILLDLGLEPPAGAAAVQA